MESQSYGASPAIWDHTVTCHPTQVSVPRFNPSHACWYSIYLPRRDGRLSLPCYSETQPPGVELATSRSRIQRANQTTCTEYNDKNTREMSLMWI